MAIHAYLMYSEMHTGQMNLYQPRCFTSMKKKQRKDGSEVDGYYRMIGRNGNAMTNKGLISGI